MVCPVCNSKPCSVSVLFVMVPSADCLSAVAFMPALIASPVPVGSLCLPACWLCWVEWRMPCNFARFGQTVRRRARLAYVIARTPYKYVQAVVCPVVPQCCVSMRKYVGAFRRSGGASCPCGQVGAAARRRCNGRARASEQTPCRRAGMRLAQVQSPRGRFTISRQRGRGRTPRPTGGGATQGGYTYLRHTT